MTDNCAINMFLLALFITKNQNYARKDHSLPVI